jgi:hypothetical protein
MQIQPLSNSTNESSNESWHHAKARAIARIFSCPAADSLLNLTNTT